MLEVLRPEEALKVIENEFSPIQSNEEKVYFEDALGRVLAEDISSTEYVPGFNRSTVDGYAIRASESFACSDAIPAVFRIQGEVKMGEKPAFALKSGAAAAIPTGGEMPEGSDACVMREYCEDYGDGSIGVLKSVSLGENVIFKGDDASPQSLLFGRNHRLRAGDIAALAALGITEVRVKKKLRIGIISTGDELIKAAGTPVGAQIRDVNSSLLKAMTEDFGADFVSYGIVRDNETELEKTARRALSENDMLLISGGSSVGEKDAAAGVIEKLGEIIFHGIAVKPGKPTILGKAENKPIFGLPGHPLAAYFITRVFVYRLMARLIGLGLTDYKTEARLRENISANDGRAALIPVKLTEESGESVAAPIRTKSGLITSLSAADGFLYITGGREGVPASERVEIIRAFEVN